MLLRSHVENEKGSTAMGENTTTSTTASGNGSNFASPVSVLPLFILLIIVLAIIIFACVLYRRAKQNRWTRRLKLTKKRIGVVAGDLRAKKTEQIEEDASQAQDTDNNGHPETIPTWIAIPNDFVAIDACTQLPTNQDSTAMYQLTYHSNRHSIGASSLYAMKNVNYIAPQSMMSLQTLQPPYHVKIHSRRPHFQGLTAHYSTVGSSADALTHFSTTPTLQRTNTLPRGYHAPCNTPNDTEDITTVSNRTTHWDSTINNTTTSTCSNSEDPLSSSVSSDNTLYIEDFQPNTTSAKEPQTETVVTKEN